MRLLPYPHEVQANVFSNFNHRERNVRLTINGDHLELCAGDAASKVLLDHATGHWVGRETLGILRLGSLILVGNGPLWNLRYSPDSDASLGTLAPGITRIVIEGDIGRRRFSLSRHSPTIISRLPNLKQIDVNQMPLLRRSLLHFSGFISHLSPIALLHGQLDEQLTAMARNGTLRALPNTIHPYVTDLELVSSFCIHTSHFLRFQNLTIEANMLVMDILDKNGQATVIKKGIFTPNRFVGIDGNPGTNAFSPWSASTARPCQMNDFDSIVRNEAAANALEVCGWRR